MEGHSNRGSGLILFGVVTVGVMALVKSFLPKKVTIKWSYPKTFYNGLYSDEAFDGWGLYTIAAKVKGKEILLYIGKAYKSNFYDRLSEHERKWLHKYSGDKYVRFGHFERPFIVSESAVHDVESALILEHQPIHNKMQKKSYTYTSQRIIKSVGNRGLIKKIFRMDDH